MDQFETFAINKGYQLEKFDRDKYVNGIVYVSGVENDVKYIDYYDKYFWYGSKVGYQTGNTNEILNLKKQIKSLGFKLYNSSFKEKNIKQEIFRNKVFELSILTFPPDDERISVWYEIDFHKH